MASIQIFIKVEDTNPNRMKFHWKTIAKKKLKNKTWLPKKKTIAKTKELHDWIRMQEIEVI